MKKKLYNLFLKYSDKLAHAFYGALFYLFLNLFLISELALFLTFALATGIEIYDKHKGGKADVLDFMATVLIPAILFILNIK
jgi:hypothetical protein